MFKLHNLLKAPALVAVALLCACLTADDLKIAIQEPRGGEELKEEAKLVKDQFSSSVTRARGFQVFDRANTEQIMSEHAETRMSGNFTDEEARALGEFKGADFVIISELTMLSDGAIRIVAQALNIVTARVVGSENKLITRPSSKTIQEASQDLMEALLKQVNISMSGRSASDAPQSLLGDDLESEIRRVLMNNRSNPKWNTNKASYSLDIDLSGVSVAENRQLGTSRITGRIYFTLTDSQSGNAANAELELQAFTEMGKPLIQRKIRDQVQSKVNNIIRDLLSELD